MAKNMEAAAKTCFPWAKLVTDRFHVVRLAIEALQHLRIKQRWEDLDKENQALEEAKKKGLKHDPPQLEIGDTPKQLLASWFGSGVSTVSLTNASTDQLTNVILNPSIENATSLQITINVNTQEGRIRNIGSYTLLLE